jgi:iron(III) transport system ATP-binding protein
VARVAVRNLVKTFEGGVRAVAGVSFDVEHGELVTLLGPSGCGKTTTLRLIAGLEAPDEGEIALGERVVTSTSRGINVPPEQRGAGMVFQSYAIWPHMTVFANVAYPLRMQGMKGLEIRARVDEILESVGLLPLKDRLATKLSGGQQQRTAIARAIVAEPSLLLLDEPLSNLDARLRAQMRVELRQLQRRLGITTIYVTHDQVEAMVLSDRVVVMNNGLIQQIGTPREIYTQPANQFVAAFVGFNNFIRGRVLERANGHLAVCTETDGLVLRCRQRPSIAEGDEVTLAVRSTNLDLDRQARESAENTFRGRVAEAIYMGEATEFRVEAGSLSLVATLSERDATRVAGLELSVGESVALSVQPDHLVALRE